MVFPLLSGQVAYTLKMVSVLWKLIFQVSKTQKIAGSMLIYGENRYYSALMFFNPDMYIYLSLYIYIYIIISFYN